MGGDGCIWTWPPISGALWATQGPCPPGPRAPGLAQQYLHGPHGLVQRVEELEAEAVLLGGPLDELTAVQQDGAHPLAHRGGLVDEQHPWLQHTPQFGPALQSPPDLWAGAPLSRPRKGPSGRRRWGSGCGQSSLVLFKSSSQITVPPKKYSAARRGLTGDVQGLPGPGREKLVAISSLFLNKYSLLYLGFHS